MSDAKGKDADKAAVYAVRASEPAAAQVEAIVERLAETINPDAAEDWQAGIREAWASLATLPGRCLTATENRYYQAKHPGPPLQVLLYRKGKSTWRILFTTHPAAPQDPPQVIVRLIRSAAQKPLTKWPPE